MVRFDDVSVTYITKGHTVRAVDSVSFSVAKGEIFGIVGLSGAGKSTLLRTINALERPTTGKVYVDGKDVASLSTEELRNLRFKAGMIFQNFNLTTSKTVFENIAFVLKAAGKTKNEIAVRVDELLKMVGLEDKRDAYPAKLSGGQKQRVGIARALANEAKLLLCDEATSSLDPQTTASILDLIKRLNKELGITVILITHELEVVKSITHRVALMAGGKLMELGDTYDIFANPTSEFAKQFIQHDQRFLLPKDVQAAAKGKIIRLQYSNSNATEPLLFKAAAANSVTPSIMHGRIDYINGKPLGILYVEMVGDEANVTKTIVELESSGIITGAVL